MEQTHQERVDTVRRMLERGASVNSIKERTGFGQATVYRMKADPNYAPSESGSARMRAASATRERNRVQEPTSLRGWVLAGLRKEGPVDSTLLTRWISNQIGKGVGLHETQHIIGSLIGQGLVKAQVRKNGTTKVYANVELTDKGWSKTGGKPPKKEGLVPHAPAAPPESAPQAPVEPPSAPEPPVVAPTPTPAEVTAQQPSPPTAYPLLTMLTRRGSKIRAAARLLEEAGLNEAAELIRNEDHTTPLEAEILRLLEDKGIDI